MTATLDRFGRATHATPVRLRFDVIDARAAKLLGVERDQVGDSALGELFNLTRETIWRFRTGRMTPSLATAMFVAEVLGLSVEAITQRMNHPPAGPSTPPPPSGPKGGK